MLLVDRNNLTETPEQNGLNLKVAAMVAAAIGGAGSAGLMLSVRSRAPLFLIILFMVWVLLPFAGLIWANFISQRWSIPTRATLHLVTFLITVASLLLYANTVFYPPDSSPAFIWLVAPGVSWLLILTLVPAAALTSREGRD